MQTKLYQNNNMRKILTLILLVPLISSAQITDTSFSQIDQRLQKASTEMIKFDKQFRAGGFVEIIGGIITVAGTVQGSQPITIAGAVIGFIGFFMNLSSSAHIKQAALIFKGNGLVVPLHRKK